MLNALSVYYFYLQSYLDRDDGQDFIEYALDCWFDRDREHRCYDCPWRQRQRNLGKHLLAHWTMLSQVNDQNSSNRASVVNAPRINERAR